MPANISKEALVFQNRIISFKEDLELIDIICTGKIDKDFFISNDVLFKLIKEEHTELRKRSQVDRSREIVVSHLRKTVYASYIKDLYEELVAYLKSVVYNSAVIGKDRQSAHRLLGEHRIEISAKDILQYNNLEDLIMQIAEDIIQKLENERSTELLIKKICKKVGLEVPEEVIKEALPFVEIRHILVHADGKMNKEFRKTYPMFKCDSKHRVNLKYDLIMKATEKITELVLAIDKSALRKGILRPNTP